MTIKKAVQTRYGQLISQRFSCCCPGEQGQRTKDIPSYGVGNPAARAALEPGERVLDIGSGAGGDCLKAAEQVGPTGEVVGLDMTDEMLAAARQNADTQGVQNVRFVKGDAESMPLEDSCFDVVLSDCVINLAADKQSVFEEINRVLKPGGRMVISDVVTDKPFSEEAQSDEELWCGCISGSLVESDYLDLMQQAGLVQVEILDRRDGGKQGDNQIIHGTYRAFKA